MSLTTRDMHIEKWLVYKTMQMGKECGEFCEHWIDYDKLRNMDDFAARQEYQEICFMPLLIISASESKVRIQIKCNSCSLARFLHTSDTRPELFCKKQFPILQKLLEEEFNKFLRKRNEPGTTTSRKSPETDRGSK